MLKTLMDYCDFIGLCYSYDASSLHCPFQRKGCRHLDTHTWMVTSQKKTQQDFFQEYLLIIQLLKKGEKWFSK